jgi:hypothetical protein
MIVCPRCSHENEGSGMHCASCRINLQWALQNPRLAAQSQPHGDEPSFPQTPALERAEKGRVPSLARGILVVILLLAIPASLFGAFYSFMGAVLDPSPRGDDPYVAGVVVFLVVGLVCIPASIVALLRRRPKPDLLGALRLVALIAMFGGLLFGLLRLTLVILPEHTGRSLVIQYKLGERDFRGANLEQADLTGADLHEANLSGVNLRGADLSGAQLYRTDLSGADLRGADLTRANLFGANLRGADLREADLTGSRVHWANLSSADLREADLTEANLYRIILSGADLSGAAVTNELLDRAGNLQGTILPDGSVHE